MASIVYARERRQFRRPIGSFQGVAFMVADMSTEVEAARNMVYRAAWLKDQGRDFALAAAKAKLFPRRRSRSARRTTRCRSTAANGYVEEYKVVALPSRREAHGDRGGDEPRSSGWSSGARC